ncbi:MAG: hypothetical protein KAG18_02685 [Sinobacterium sp.]|nr:hypothetical protein [Sinobacterium sp.]
MNMLCYKNQTLALCIFIVLSIFSLSTQASSTFESMFIDPKDGQLDASAFLTENSYGFLPVPIIITDPSVKGGLGLVGLFFHEDDESRTTRQEALRTSDKASKFLFPPSVSFVSGVATGNKSYAGGGGHLGFFKEGTIRYFGFAGAVDVNLDFYGSTGMLNNPDADKILNDYLARNPLDIKTKAIFTVHHVKFKMPALNLFLGPKVSFLESEISINTHGGCSHLPDNACNELSDLLESDVRNIGLGLVGEWDSRTNFFSPQEGYNLQLEYMVYNDALGSDLNYEYFMLKDLNYWKLSERFRTNLRLDWQAAITDDQLPPFVIPSVSLRGAPAMKYQGKRVAVAEAEVIWQINYRWSVSAFAGSGRAAQATKDLSSSPSINTQGLGFRYRMARRYGFDMGLDVAQGPDDTVFYIQAGSAW